MFDYAAPNVGFLPTNLNYLDNKVHNLYRRRKTYSSLEVRSMFSEFTNHKTKCADKLSGFMDDWNVDMFMKTTVGMSYFKPTHVFTDESGVVGSSDSDFSYDKDSISMTLDIYRKTRKKTFTGVIPSVPRAKLTGWPLQVSGMEREKNDMTLYANAKIVAQARKEGLKLPELVSIIGKSVGSGPYYMYGERFMHTAKNMPIFTNDGFVIKDLHLAPRVRIVNASPKMHVMWNRPYVKELLLDFIQPSNHHNPDVAYVTSKVSKYMDSGWLVIALDYSRFDQRFGGKRLKTVVKMCSDLLGNKDVETDFNAELDMPALVPFGNKFVSYTKGDFLPSGASMTSIAGCVGNTLSLVEVARNVYRKLGKSFSPSEVGRSIDWHSWGDDTLLFINVRSLSIDADKATDLFFNGFKDIRLEVSDEDKIKFLGHEFTYKGTGNVERHLSDFRFFQNRCFPERTAMEPLYDLGFSQTLGEFQFIKGKNLASLMEVVTFIRAINPKLRGYQFKEPAYYEGGLKAPAFLKGMEFARKNANGLLDLDSILYTLTRGEDIEEIYEMLGVPDEARSWRTVDDMEKEHFVSDDFIKQMKIITKDPSLYGTIFPTLDKQFTSTNNTMSDWNRSDKFYKVDDKSEFI